MKDILHDLTCPQCHIGQLQLRLITYVQMYGETLVTAPNMPAWECDVCHAQRVSPEAIQTVEVLISPAGPPPNRYQPPAGQVAPTPKRKTQPDAGKPTRTTASRTKAKIKS